MWAFIIKVFEDLTLLITLSAIDFADIVSSSIPGKPLENVALLEYCYI